MPPKNRQSLRPPPMRRSATPLAGHNLTRSALPAEIIASILDYLPVRDLMRFARVSKRLREMVYDDTRWVQRLKLMGVWNETEARQRFDDAMRRKRAAEAAKRAEEEKKFAESRAAKQAGRSSTLFDAEEEKKAAAQKLAGAVDLMSIRPTRAVAQPAMVAGPDALLTILKGVKSVRGFARQEYARIHAALGPLYFDLVRARTHTDPEVFRIYRDPEKQAAMLAQLWKFGDGDTAVGWQERTERLKAMMEVFENAALREFEGGYESGDVDGRMKRYAHVLITLNGGQACIQLFVQKHPLLYERDELGNPLDCFDKPEVGMLSLEPSREFFRALAGVLIEQTSVIDRVFPPTVNVLLPFLERVAEDVISEYATPILDEAHNRETEQYLKAVTGLFRQSMEFGASLTPTKGSGSDFREDVAKVMVRVFDAHIDLYLQEELDHFRKQCESEVDEWEKKISEQEATTESFFMSNVNREADKKDFLTTFRKVILAPISVIPSAFNVSKPHSTPTPKPETNPYIINQENRLSLPSTAYSAHPSVNGSEGDPTSRASSPAPAPTSELAAKAALMNSRLESIRSLFSLDIALSLVHKAKAALERAAEFAKVGGQTGEEAREQCEMIFVTLLQILGPRHVKAGFDKAVEHLKAYNPRSVATHAPEHGVAPLVTFLDLVNVGDLIQQMIDVFYEQELVAAGLTDRNDFLNPATKEKKRFEQMLDERVAAGLNTGIDVLIAEVEHIFATTQHPHDFHPRTAPATPCISPTARAVISTITSHTSLLSGSIDKNVLDVFNQEVGVRLFAAICKHIKRSRVSVDGAVNLICDLNHYYEYVVGLKIKPLMPYFVALRELAQIYLIDPTHAKQMAQVIADPARFGGIWRVEEVYEYAARREDWFRVKKDVERAMYGMECVVM